jgi:hypothetical protein
VVAAIMDIDKVITLLITNGEAQTGLPITLIMDIQSMTRLIIILTPSIQPILTLIHLITRISHILLILIMGITTSMMQNITNVILLTEDILMKENTQLLLDNSIKQEAI